MHPVYVLVVLDIAEERSPAVLDLEEFSRAALDLESGSVGKTDFAVEQVTAVIAVVCVVVCAVVKVIVVLDNFVGIEV